MQSWRDVSLASASHNLGDQTLGLEAIDWKPGASIVDIGCGPGVHLNYFRSKGLIPTGVDRCPENFRFTGEIELVEDVADLDGRRFDYLFASHVLEHCPDTFTSLGNWLNLLNEGGTMIVFVPPFSDYVSNDHWVTGWNVGQLAMTLVAAGLDCSESMFYQNKEQVFGHGIKSVTPRSFFIDDCLPFLPPAIARGLYNGGGYQNLRGDISYLHRDRLEYLPRRRRHVAIASPDDTWRKVEDSNGEWHDVSAPSLSPLRSDANYIIAIECATSGAVRAAFCHDGFSEHAEVWINLQLGLNIFQVELADLEKATDGFSVSLVNMISIGGPTRFLRAAIFCEGHRLF